MSTSAYVRQAIVIGRVAMLSERKHVLQAYTLLFLILAAVLGMFKVGDSPFDGALFVPALPLTVLAMFYWDRFIIQAIRQNTPACASLVPRQHASMRLAVILAWLIAVAPCLWLATGFAQGPLIVVLYANYLAAAGLMRAGYGVGKVIYLSLYVFAIFVWRDESLVAALVQWPVAVGLMVVTLVVAALCLRLAFPSAGERHWRILPEQKVPVHLFDLPEIWVAQLSFGQRHALYGIKLDYDVRHGARPAQMLLHALGAHIHRFDLVLPLVAVSTVIGIVWLLNLSQAGLLGSLSMVLIWPIMAVLLPLHFFRMRRIVSAINATAAEQALVRLAPRAPRASDMGRVLAKELLMISVCEWLAILFVVVLGGALLMKGITWQAARPVMQINASVVIASFAMNGWALRDYSDKQPASFGSGILLGAILTGSVFAMVSFVQWPLIWIALGGLVLLLGAWIIMHRWRTMAVAPAPFPAARFGL